MGAGRRPARGGRAGAAAAGRGPRQRVERAVAVGVAEFPTSGAEWDALSLPHKREAARHVVESIVLAPFPTGAPKKGSIAGERVTITWRR